MCNQQWRHTLRLPICVCFCVCWLAVGTQGAAQGAAQGVGIPTNTTSDVGTDTQTDTQTDTRTDVWTLQVGQYHNEQRARSQVSRLQRMGFDAYLEPSFAGLIRVRVGCFLSLAAARTLASLLQGRVDTVMVLTPLSADANVQLCTYQQIGFITPAMWGIQQVSPQGVVFWIQLASQTGYVVYHEGWHVSQDEPRLLEQPTAEPRTELQVSQSAFVVAPLIAADASLPSLDVVRYQLAAAPAEVPSTPRRITEPATLETRSASANLDTENLDTRNVGTENLDTENLDTENLDTENTDAESSLAASLARLPKRPRVSLHTANETVTEVDTTTLDETADATPIPQQVTQSTQSQITQSQVTQSIVISSGDILWQNDHEVVIYQHGTQQEGTRQESTQQESTQQQGRLVLLKVVPISSLSSSNVLGTARE